MKNITEISNLEQAKGFINQCVTFVGTGFHPDTPFEDYVNLKDMKILFSAESATEHNALIDKCFDIFNENNEDIYEYTLNTTIAIFNN